MEHSYNPTVRWTGNRGTGTSGNRDFSRDHVIEASGKPTLTGSSDPAFLGDPGRWNPEELLVASLSSCHMLWYLHLCSDAGVIVTSYADSPVGVMSDSEADGGRFLGVTLNPEVIIQEGSDVSQAEALHAEAHRKCFIANSINFPVRIVPSTRSL